MSALKLCFFIQAAVVAMSALAQTPSEQNSPLPSQAKEVHGLAVPVPKEIFRSLDQFRDANWSAVKRPEVARWKSRGDQAQIATLLGVVIAEGFIAMKAKDSTEVENLGRTVLALARGLGVEERALFAGVAALWSLPIRMTGLRREKNGMVCFQIWKPE